MDLHKETHTAVMVNCWNEKLDVMVIENKPSEFEKLAKRVNKMSVKLSLTPVYGLENAYAYGRSLAVKKPPVLAIIIWCRRGRISTTR